MKIDLTPEQQVLITAAVTSGRFDREEDAVLEALLQWEQRERWHAKVLTDVSEADAVPRKPAAERVKVRTLTPLAELPLFPA